MIRWKSQTFFKSLTVCEIQLSDCSINVSLAYLLLSISVWACLSSLRSKNVWSRCRVIQWEAYCHSYDSLSPDSHTSKRTYSRKYDSRTIMDQLLRFWWWVNCRIPHVAYNQLHSHILWVQCTVQFDYSEIYSESRLTKSLDYSWRLTGWNNFLQRWMFAHWKRSLVWRFLSYTYLNILEKSSLWMLLTKTASISVILCDSQTIISIISI